MIIRHKINLLSHPGYPHDKKYICAGIDSQIQKKRRETLLGRFSGGIIHPVKTVYPIPDESTPSLPEIAQIACGG
jgi:hypothetical protein